MPKVLSNLYVGVSRRSYPQAECRRSLILRGRKRLVDSRGGGAECSSTPAPSACLRPDRAPVNAVLLRQREHADAALPGCSHSVHFLLRKPCSRSFLWFRRCADQSVIRLALGVGIVARPLIPRGNELLNPWSSVPAAPNCFHQEKASRHASRGLRGLRPVCGQASRDAPATCARSGAQSCGASSGRRSSTVPPCA